MSSTTERIHHRTVRAPPPLTTTITTTPRFEYIRKGRYSWDETQRRLRRTPVRIQHLLSACSSLEGLPLANYETLSSLSSGPRYSGFSSSSSSISHLYYPRRTPRFSELVAPPKPLAILDGLDSGYSLFAGLSLSITVVLTLYRVLIRGLGGDIRRAIGEKESPRYT
jgi:hypothetical protein